MGDIFNQISSQAMKIWKGIFSTLRGLLLFYGVFVLVCAWFYTALLECQPTHFHFPSNYADADYRHVEAKAKKVLLSILLTSLTDETAPSGEEIINSGVHFNEQYFNREDEKIADKFSPDESWKLVKIELFDLAFSNNDSVTFNSRFELWQGRSSDNIELGPCEIYRDPDLEIYCSEVSAPELRISGEQWEYFSELKTAKDGYVERGLFLRMLYFSVVTATGLGFGDIVPVSVLSRAVVTFEAFVGLVLLGLLIGRIISTKSTKA